MTEQEIQERLRDIEGYGTAQGKTPEDIARAKAKFYRAQGMVADEDLAHLQDIDSFAQQTSKSDAERIRARNKYRESVGLPPEEEPKKGFRLFGIQFGGPARAETATTAVKTPTTGNLPETLGIPSVYPLTQKPTISPAQPTAAELAAMKVRDIIKGKPAPPQDIISTHPEELGGFKAAPSGSTAVGTFAQPKAEPIGGPRTLQEMGKEVERVLPGAATVPTQLLSEGLNQWLKEPGVPEALTNFPGDVVQMAGGLAAFPLDMIAKVTGTTLEQAGKIKDAAGKAVKTGDGKALSVELLKTGPLAWPVTKPVAGMARDILTPWWTAAKYLIGKATPEEAKAYEEAAAKHPAGAAGELAMAPLMALGIGHGLRRANASLEGGRRVVGKEGASPLQEALNQMEALAEEAKPDQAKVHGMARLVQTEAELLRQRAQDLPTAKEAAPVLRAAADADRAVMDLKTRIGEVARAVEKGELEPEAGAIRLGEEVGMDLDDLTGLPNQDKVRRELRKTEGSVAVFDTDNFKGYKDLFKEDFETAGDAIIAEAGARFGELAEKYGVEAGRRAGDEFSVWKKDATPEELAPIAERIRMEIGEEPFHILGREVKVSFSGGVGKIDPLNKVAQDAAATRALKAAKDSGRGKTKVNGAKGMEEVQAGAFVPSREWQEVPEGTTVPEGLEIRMDMETGKNFARLSGSRGEGQGQALLDKTGLMPTEIADHIIRDRQAELSKTLSPEDLRWFADNATDRFKVLLEVNDSFGKHFKGQKGLDSAFGFINHWLDAFVKDPAKYRKWVDLQKEPSRAKRTSFYNPEESAGKAIMEQAREGTETGEMVTDKIPATKAVERAREALARDKGVAPESLSYIGDQEGNKGKPGAHLFNIMDPNHPNYKSTVGQPIRLKAEEQAVRLEAEGGIGRETAEVIASKPLEELPVDVAAKVQEMAAYLIDKSDTWDRELSTHTGAGLTPVEMNALDPTGKTFDKKIAGSNTYPEGWKELKATREQVVTALDKIVKDRGLDKGAVVERVKKWIASLMEEGGDVGGGLFSKDFPADPSFKVAVNEWLGIKETEGQTALPGMEKPTAPEFRGAKPGGMEPGDLRGTPLFDQESFARQGAQGSLLKPARGKKSRVNLEEAIGKITGDFDQMIEDFAAPVGASVREVKARRVDDRLARPATGPGTGKEGEVVAGAGKEAPGALRNVQQGQGTGGAGAFPEKSGAGRNVQQGDYMTPQEIKEALKLDEPEAETRWRASEGAKNVREPILGKVRGDLIAGWESFTRHFPKLNPRTDGMWIDILRRVEESGNYAKAVTEDILRGITAKLGPVKYDIFKKNIILPDIIKDVDRGLLRERVYRDVIPEDVKRAQSDRASKIVKLKGELRQIDEDLRKTTREYRMPALRTIKPEGVPLLKEKNALRNDLIMEISRESRVYGTEELRLEGTGLPFGFKNRESLTRNAARFDALAKANPDIREAVKKRNDFINAMTRKQVEVGLLPEQVLKQPAYFHHQVMEYIGMKRGLGLTQKDLRLHRKGYQIARKGSSKDFNTEYLEAEREVLAQGLYQIEVAKAIQQMRDFADIAPSLKFQARAERRLDFSRKKAQMEGKETKPGTWYAWKGLKPEDYVEWQPERGNIFYPAMAINDRIVNQLLSGGGLNRSDMRQVQALAGRKQEWVIPQRLAETLDDFKTKLPDEGPVARAAHFLTSSWKQWVLLNPMRVIKYNLNNLSGDLDIALAYNPKILKYTPGAVRDLIGTARGKSMTVEMREALHDGVIQSGMTMREIENIQERGMFKFVTGGAHNLPEKYWNAVRGATNLRENILRVAAYRFFKDELAAGKKVYGASRPLEMDAIPEKFVKQRAAKLARELIGDYGNISQSGQWLRKYMIPFYSWVEINAPRYVRLIRNLPLEGKSGVGFTAMRGGALAVKASGLYALITLYNHTMWPDEEKELGIDNQRDLHLILGRREDGSIRTMRLGGALADALSWWGAEDLPYDIAELRSGKKTWKEYLVETSTAPLNKLVQGSLPGVKALMEAGTGKSFYPDITKPRPIRNKMENLLRQVTLDVPYRLVPRIFGKVTTPTRGVGPELTNVLFYSSDPGEGAYFQTRKMVTDFLDSKGEEAGQVAPTRRANALYYYKQALRYKDTKAAEKFLKDYYRMGGTGEGIDKSIERSQPLTLLLKKPEIGPDGEKVYPYYEEFLRTRSKEEQEMIKKAIAWWLRTYQPGGGGQPAGEKKPEMAGRGMWTGAMTGKR